MRTRGLVIAGLTGMIALAVAPVIPDAAFETRERGAEADVDAVAEGDGAFHLAAHVEDIGVGKLALVAVAGAEQ